jgi:hypothetical protein
MIGALRLALGGLLLWTPLAWGQHLSGGDAAALIEKSRQKALDYAHSLPDFLCTEVIRRYSDSRPQNGKLFGRPLVPMQFPAGMKWIPTDKLTVRLSFFQLQEEHTLVAINDRPSDQKYAGLAGATSGGEFGGMMKSIFDPASQTAFRWESWRGRKRRTAVYAYEVSAAHSQFVLANGKPGAVHHATVGFHGTIEIDGDTAEVLHYDYMADRIPKELSLESALTTVDYAFAGVGGRDYLLPSRCQTEMHSPELSVRNDTEFREYRKFSSESTVTFGAGK